MTSPMGTRTGNIPIGFRRGWSDWQKNLDSLSGWAKNVGFEGIDLGGHDIAANAAVVARHGLKLGSVDLADMGGLWETDPGKRKDAIARNTLRRGRRVGAYP